MAFQIVHIAETADPNTPDLDVILTNASRDQIGRGEHPDEAALIPLAGQE